MTRRPGLSLVEVLAAIFIMGIGLISLFTLFPYGGLKYAEAFKDDRTTQSANAAEMFMRTYWKERVLELHASSTQEPFSRSDNPQPDAMDDPNSDPVEQAPFTPTPGRVPGAIQKPPVPSPPGTPPVVPSLLLPTQPDPSAPSYPLFVDPMGWTARAGRSDRYWVAEGGPNEGRVPRRNLFDVEQFSQRVTRSAGTVEIWNKYALRACSLMDGLTYAPDGRGANFEGRPAEDPAALSPVVQRELRYNWLWVLQRANNQDRTSARMTVVVFDKRADKFAPTSAEVVYPVAGTSAQVGLSTINYPTVSVPPGLKKGMWLLDATTLRRSVTLPGPTPQPVFYSAIRNANFYRVVSVTPNGAQTDIELHQPIKGESKPRTDPLGNVVRDVGFDPAFPNEQRQFVLLAGVADVYEKAPLTNTPAKP